MDQNQWFTFFVGIALASGLIALGVVMYSNLKARQPGSIVEATIEAALLPLIYQGICAAYRLNEMSLEQLHEKLKDAGKHKKEVADSIYAMLPDKIGEFDIIIVKRLVTQERFEQLVQAAFDRFDRFYVEHQSHFDDLFSKWQAQNAPVSFTTTSTAGSISLPQDQA
jgi:hypothetical protein